MKEQGLVVTSSTEEVGRAIQQRDLQIPARPAKNELGTDISSGLAPVNFHGQNYT